MYMDCTNCPLEGKCVNYSAADHGCMQTLLQKLAAYEDSGYTPEQVQKHTIKTEQVIKAQLSEETIKRITTAQLTDETIKRIAEESVKAQKLWLKALVGSE